MSNFTTLKYKIDNHCFYIKKVQQWELGDYKQKLSQVQVHCYC